jgi:tetratricopeptide (TPR) repeat protein
MKPLCFVLMPFGTKPEGGGRTIDFDAVYGEIIAPAVAEAGMEVIRADQEQIGGTIHKPMFERLMLCDFAVADITGANPNVYYELGIRHALRPRSTVLVFAEGTMLPFDIASQRGTPYRLDGAGRLADAAGDRQRIAGRLRSAQDVIHDDSPLFQLIDGMPRIEIDHAKTDIFRDRVAIARDYRNALEEARKNGIAAVRAVAADPRLADLRNVEAGIIVDLMLSFRATGTREGCEEMIALHARMPRELQSARLIREQLGFALNRVGRRAEAEKVLSEVIREFGQNSETNGLLGRVYKDLYDEAKSAGRGIEAKGYLKRAIASYRAGFEADWRDAYPGINAVTLMEMQDPPDPAQKDLLPVVRYAAMQRIRRDEHGVGDYWDHATLIELAVLARAPGEAEEHAAAALSVVKEPWQPATTARNLRLIRETREARGEDAAWIAGIEAALAEAEARLRPVPAA